MPNIRPPKRLVSHELINFAARDTAAFVELCEQRYAARLAHTAGTLLGSGCNLVMLTGPSGVGKTTSANRLAAEIEKHGKKCVVVSLDDFFVGAGRYPKRADGSDDYECPEALDLPALRGFLRELVESGRSRMPTFDFVTQLPRKTLREVDCAGGIAIVEGLHALNPMLTAELPEGSVRNVYASLREEYADVNGKRSVQTRELRLARRITRDCQFRGHAPDFTLELWPHVCASERVYVQAYRDRADLILDTSFSYEPCLWGKVLAGLAGVTAPSHAAQFETLRREFAGFAPIEDSFVPDGSMLREFIGPKV